MGGGPWDPKGVPWEGIHGRGNPWELKGIPWDGVPDPPWEGFLGSPRDPMGGDPWGPHWAPLGAHSKIFCDELTFKKLRKSWTSSFLMFSKTRFGETSREKIRMVRAVLPESLNPPPNFNLNVSFPRFTIVGGTAHRQGSVCRQLGHPMTTWRCSIFSVSRDTFLRNSVESMRNRGLVTFQPSVLLIERSRPRETRSL